jgi:hypothetical protein
MDFSEIPVPQESGQLVPPSRRPPTAVGLAMLPAPLPPPGRAWRRRQFRFNHPLVKSAEWIAIGTTIAWLAPWTAARIAGLTFGALGLGAGLTWLTIRFAVRPLARAWRM